MKELRNYFYSRQVAQHFDPTDQNKEIHHKNNLNLRDHNWVPSKEKERLLPAVLEG